MKTFRFSYSFSSKSGRFLKVSYFSDCNFLKNSSGGCFFYWNFWRFLQSSASKNKWPHNCKEKIYSIISYISNNTILLLDSFWLICIYLLTNALSFYVTKTVLVSPKWFWSYQIDLDLTIMIWSRPKWNGHDQNELVRSKL